MLLHHVSRPAPGPQPRPPYLSHPPARPRHLPTLHPQSRAPGQAVVTCSFRVFFHWKDRDRVPHPITTPTPPNH